MPRNLDQLDNCIEVQRGAAFRHGMDAGKQEARGTLNVLTKEQIFRSMEALVKLAEANATIAKEIGFGFHALERNK